MIILLLGTLPGAAMSAGPLPDLAGHWSEPDVRQAVAEGWVNGYPEGRFLPGGPVSRAEFVKLLAAATGLAPDRETARALVEAATSFIPTNPEAVLTDLKGHWLATQGWLKPAAAFGLIIPGDYAGGKFEPGQAITRQEIAVMAVRALGLVYLAANDKADLSFKDRDRLAQWSRGYVHQAVLAGILKGYPDGTFGGDQPATRAEAVVIVRRTLAVMSVGADPAIKLFVKTKQDQSPVPVPLPVPARFIDGQVYVPARSVLRALAPGIASKWDPAAQQLIHRLTFTAGSDMAARPLQTTRLEMKMVAPARLALGELLLPVRFANSDSSPFFRTGALFWEPSLKHLTIYAAEGD